MGVWKPVDVTGDKPSPGGPIIRSSADAASLGMAYQIEASKDGTRRFTFVGQRCQAVNGIPAETAMADPAILYNMVLPEHREAFAVAEAQAVALTQPFDVEVAMRRADGVVRWHRIAAIPRPQPDGRVLWDGLQIDVTDRRRLASELEEQRRRVEIAVEATDMGLWEVDLRSETLTWSDRNRRLFGLSPEAPVTPQIYMDLVCEEDRPIIREAFERARDLAGPGDFTAEYRIITPAGEARWVWSRGRVIRDDEGPRLLVGTSLDMTERRAADERRNLLTRELAHRAKNFISVVMSIVSQTARGQESVQEFRDLLMARLQSMAASQDLVTATGGHAIDVSGVITKSLAPFDIQRFQIDGGLAEVAIDSTVAVGMGLLLHEMATNATKYGSLSNSKGRVVIGRAAAPNGRVAFEWHERDGPKVMPSDRRGFGTRLLEQVLRNQGGAVKFAFEPAGFRAHVECPAAN
jgi:PAS domain S-box-containing protein